MGDFHRCHPLPHPHPCPLTPLLLPPRPPPHPCSTLVRSLMAFSAEPAGEEAEEESLAPAAAGAGDGGKVSTEEWRCWGTSSPLPAMVAAVVHKLLEMEVEAGEKMSFGSAGSELKGDFKDMEDKKHRAIYETLADSDKMLRYFLARQIACSNL